MEGKGNIIVFFTVLSVQIPAASQIAALNVIQVVGQNLF